MIANYLALPTLRHYICLFYASVCDGAFFKLSLILVDNRICLCCELKWPQEKLKTMLMQNFGVSNKEHYGMLWYFLEWSIQRNLSSPYSVNQAQSLLRKLNPIRWFS